MARLRRSTSPATLTHEPTRRFLRETGLPEEAVLFHADTDVPLPTLREYVTEERPRPPPSGNSPPTADHSIRLGGGCRGTAAWWSTARNGRGPHLRRPRPPSPPLNTDVSTLAFTLWLIHHERTIDDHLGEGAVHHAYDHLVVLVITPSARSTRRAPLPETSWHYWTELFRDETGRGALSRPDAV
ncbi:SUKH-4 family immunity protein [Streptomyces tricolor]|nr:SUKH-4 family immunity protein [Streptomyces tricolor]